MFINYKFLKEKGDDMAKLRLIHASSDATGLDVYLDNNKIIERINYKTISQYFNVPNECTLDFRISGAPKNSPPVFYVKLKIEPEFSSLTAFLIGLVGSKDKKDRINVIILPDQPPTQKSAIVRFINASPSIPTATFKLKDGSFMQNLEYGKVAHSIISPGKKVIQVIKDNEILTENNIDILEGKFHEILLIGLIERKPPLELYTLTHD